MLRTRADALRDPRPGDVVAYGPPWQKTVVEVQRRSGDTVHTINDGACPAVYSLDDWIDRMSPDRMCPADVVYVAQEGGEG